MPWQGQIRARTLQEGSLRGVFVRLYQMLTQLALPELQDPGRTQLLVFEDGDDEEGCHNQT